MLGYGPCLVVSLALRVLNARFFAYTREWC